MAFEQETEKGLQDYVALFRRRKQLLLVPASALFLVAALVAFGLPAVYRSSATILIEEQEIPKDMVRSAITSYADQRIQVITQRSMTTANIIEVIEKHDLYADRRARQPISLVVETFRENVNMDLISADVVDPRSGRPTQATIAFTLSFDYGEQQTAQKVANELVSLYLSENVRTRRETAAETKNFLGDEVDRLDTLITQAETALADFKEENSGSLPEQLDINIQLMERTDRELMETERQIQTVRERIIYLESEIVQINPYGTYMVDGRPVMSAQDQLKALRTEHIKLSGVYGPRHPDVIKVQREITALTRETGATPDPAELERQLGEVRTNLAKAQEKYAADHPDVIRLKKELDSVEKARAALGAGATTAAKKPADHPDNPAYIQIQAQLESAKSDLKSLLGQRATLRSKREDYEKRIIQTPQVERNYLKLQRSYDNTRSKYQEVKAKQMDAELSEAMESERKSERFSLIEPPQFPLQPIKPNRFAILFLGVVFSLAAGVGVVVLSENIAPRIYNSRQLAAATGTLPLVVVPYIENSEDIDRTHRMRRNSILGAGVAVASFLIAAHLLIAPLDVLWFKVLLRLGLGNG